MVPDRMVFKLSLISRLKKNIYSNIYLCYYSLTEVCFDRYFR